MDSARVETLPATAPAAARQRRTFWIGAVVVAACIVGAGVGLHALWRLSDPGALPLVEPIDVFASLFDVSPTTFVTTANWQKIRVTVPRWQFLRDHTLWRRMHFEDWDRLPGEIRAAGLRQVFDRHGRLTTARDAWTMMNAEDWDSVPQPIRAMAFVTMIEYWVSFYRVGDAFGLDSREVLQTIKAVAMTESWFDHRAEYINRDGSRDIDLGGASGFARRVVRRWHREGKCDFRMTDDDYANPWLASRWLAFWFDLMLHEAGGDIDLAIRAYNWGIGRAIAGAGEPYLQMVQRRRHRYFEGPSQSPTWRTLSQYRREQLAARRSRAATMRTFGSTRARSGTIDDISWNSRHVATRGSRRFDNTPWHGSRAPTRCLQ